MTTLHLTEDEIDEILYLSRVNESTELSTYLTSLSQSRNLSPSSILTHAIDPYNQNTGLHYAAANGHVEILSLLSNVFESRIPKGILNARNSSQNTPLHWAALNGHLGVVKRLLELGADAALINGAGYDAVFEAENAGKTEVVELLLRDAVGLEKGIAGSQGNGEGSAGGKDVDGDMVMKMGDTSGEGEEVNGGLDGVVGGDEDLRKEVEKMTVDGEAGGKGKDKAIG